MLFDIQKIKDHPAIRNKFAEYLCKPIGELTVMELCEVLNALNDIGTLVITDNKVNPIVSANEFFQGSYSFEITKHMRTMMCDAFRKHGFINKNGKINLTTLSENELIRVRKIGPGSLKLIKQMVKERGFELKP